jgi:hypothetical protein
VNKKSFNYFSTFTEHGFAASALMALQLVLRWKWLAYENHLPQQLPG